MPMTISMVVSVVGKMSASKLESIRNALGLRVDGRLEDVEDGQFGYRYLREDEGNLVLLELWRVHEFLWQVRLTYQNEAPADEVVEQLRTQTMAAAREAGLDVEGS